MFGVELSKENKGEKVMLITIDIGNSYVSFGCYKGENLEFVSDIVTDNKKSVDQYAVEFGNIMKLYNIDTQNISGGIISSVVPELTAVVAEAIAKLCKISCLIVGPGVKSGININIENPAQLGADTVAEAVAVIEKFPCPAIICDLGTATVMGVIDKNKNFNGCIIAAGVGTTSDSFSNNTALLPHVSIDTPKRLIGKNTVNSVQSGLIFGTAAMIDGLISRIERELGEKTTVIATGKMTEKIIPHCDREIIISDYLVFEGLRLIYQKNQEK